jgi:hypothetical protein
MGGQTMAVATEARPQEQQLVGIGSVLNIELDLASVGPDEQLVTGNYVLPFAADLMMRGHVAPGPVSPTATHRTPVERKTTVSTFKNNQADTSFDVDISYDQSDPK